MTAAQDAAIETAVANLYNVTAMLEMIGLGLGAMPNAAPHAETAERGAGDYLQRIVEVLERLDD